MGERKYKVIIGTDVVAENVELRTATILVRALFEEYYNDYTLAVTIKEMDRATEVCR